MIIRGQAWDSPGDGGDVEVYFDFYEIRDKVLEALKEYQKDNGDDGYAEDEDFLSEYLPDVYDEIEQAVQDAAADCDWDFDRPSIYSDDDEYQEPEPKEYSVSFYQPTLDEILEECEIPNPYPSDEYPIDAIYDFEAFVDDARPCSTGMYEAYVRWDQDIAMKMGKLFSNKEDNGVVVDDDIIEKLRRNLVESLYDEAREYLEENRDEDEYDDEDDDESENETAAEISEEEIKSRAEEMSWEYNFYWSSDLKDDCIQYYEENK